MTDIQIAMMRDFESKVEQVLKEIDNSGALSDGVTEVNRMRMALTIAAESYFLLKSQTGERKEYANLRHFV
jgi:hypothetical protein